MTKHADCLLCYSNARGRSNYKGHFGYRPLRDLRLGVMEMIKRNRASGNAAAVGADAPWDAGSGPGQATWEFLTCTQWPDDRTPRKTGTLMFFSEGPAVKVCLNDRDALLVAFLVIPVNTDVWEWLEEQLLSSQLEWRASKPAEGKKGK